MLAGMATRTTTPAAPTSGVGCGLLLFRLARVSGEGLTEALGRIGMRPAEFAVLEQLDSSGPISQQALGRALRMHPSNLVGMIDLLEAAGLLLRPRDPGDRRRYLLELTARGRRRLAEAHRAVVEAELEILAPLTPAEQKRLRGYLERLAGHSCAPRDRCGPPGGGGS